MSDFFKERGQARNRQSPRRRAKRPKRDVFADFSRWPECAEHAFFKAKGVPVPPGIRMMGSDFAVPVHAPGGEMISWQIISPRGDKRFKNGNRLGKRYFFKLDGAERDRIYIAEGLAAAASVYEATGRKHAVLYAFSKSNADDLAEGFLLEGSPKQKIVLCLDNEGEKTHRPRLQHERLIVLCPEAKGDFNEHQRNEKERKKLLKLAPAYKYETAEDRLSAGRAAAYWSKTGAPSEAAAELLAKGGLSALAFNEDYILVPAKGLTIISGKELKSRLNLAPESKPAGAPAKTPAKVKAAVSVRAVSKAPAAADAEGREGRFSFYAGLFQEKRAWTAGEIVKRAAKTKEAGGRALSRAQVFRHLREFEDKGRLKKSGKRPLTEYKAAGVFSAWAAEGSLSRHNSPETIEIEGEESENEFFAAEAA